MKRTRLRQWIKRLAVGAAALLVMLVLAGFLFETVAGAASVKRYPPPGALMDVGGHRLHMHCIGAGSPTVILDAGGGPHGSLSWRPVHAELARDTRVCAYDRAGILWSERGPEPRSGERAVAELAALLQEAEISGPVVLVGHSLGGQFAVQFAHRHPERIAGLVLVDASHPSMLDRLPVEIREAFVPPRPLRTIGRLAASLGILRIASGSPPPVPNLTAEEARALAAFIPRSFATNMKEIDDAVLAGGFVPRSGVLDGRPVVMLSAAEFGPGEPPGWRPEWSREYMRVWHEMQDSLALVFPGVQRSVIAGSDHMIHWNAPDMVIHAIRGVLLEARQLHSAGAPGMLDPGAALPAAGMVAPASRGQTPP
jgi:pimeloyl-ACP methyl ester carboxylesterase